MSNQTRHTVNGSHYVVWHPPKDCASYSLSYDGGGWMPGSYDSVASALRGAECCMINESKFVSDIQSNVNHFEKGNRDLSLSDMAEFKQLENE